MESNWQDKGCLNITGKAKLDGQKLCSAVTTGGDEASLSVPLLLVLLLHEGQEEQAEGEGQGGMS